MGEQGELLGWSVSMWWRTAHHLCLELSGVLKPLWTSNSKSDATVREKAAQTSHQVDRLSLVILSVVAPPAIGRNQKSSLAIRFYQAHMLESSNKVVPSTLNVRFKAPVYRTSGSSDWSQPNSCRITLNRSPVHRHLHTFTVTPKHPHRDSQSQLDSHSHLLLY